MIHDVSIRSDVEISPWVADSKLYKLHSQKIKTDLFLQSSFFFLISDATHSRNFIETSRQKQSLYFQISIYLSLSCSLSLAISLCTLPLCSLPSCSLPFCTLPLCSLPFPLSGSHFFSFFTSLWTYLFLYKYLSLFSSVFLFHISSFLYTSTSLQISFCFVGQ